MSSVVIVVLVIVVVIVIVGVSVGLYLWFERRRRSSGTKSGSLTLIGTSGSLFTFTLPKAIPTPPSSSTPAYVSFSVGTTETTPSIPQYLVAGGGLTISPSPASSSKVKMTKVSGGTTSTPVVLTASSQGIYLVPSS